MGNKLSERGKVMEGYHQALLDTALNHELVVSLIEELKTHLHQIGREDVIVSTGSWLSVNGVSVRVSVIYDSFYPGEIISNPDKVARLRQDEISLRRSLQDNGFVLLPAIIIGDSKSIKVHQPVFEAIVNYQGEISPI